MSKWKNLLFGVKNPFKIRSHYLMGFNRNIRVLGDGYSESLYISIACLLSPFSTSLSLIADISSKLELRRQLRSDTRKDRKRLVKNSCCALCGDVKYTPPPSKNLAPLLSHRSRADRPSQTVCQKDAGHITESPTAVNFRFEKYPTVNLCNVARVFDLASRDFSCVLPAALRQKRKCKRVQCLRKELDFLVHPHLHDIKECRSKIANQSWEVSTPNHSCASFSSGDPPSGAMGSMYVSDTTETPDGSAKEWDACLARNPDCESMRPTDVEGTVLSGCDVNGPVLHFCEKDKACPMTNISESPTSPARLVSPLILRRVAVNGFGFRGGDDTGENSGHSLDKEKEEDSSNEDSDSEVNSPESFSCQRVQAYIFFPQSSCARTYKTWPFPRMGPRNELGSPLHTGPGWIVSTSFPAILQTSFSGAPECLSDKDIQNELSKPTNQSKSSNETREVLDGQPLSSFVPDETTLAVLERTQKGRAQSLNPSCTMPQDSFFSRLTDHSSCRLESRDLMEQQPSALGKMPPICTLENASKDRAETLKPRGTLTQDSCILKLPDQNSCSLETRDILGQQPSESGEKTATCTPERTPSGSKVILTCVSKPAEPESKQSLKKALDDVLESSLPVVTEQVYICKFSGLGNATSLEECSLQKNHCLLKKSDQKVLSSGSEIQVDFIRKDQKLSKDVSDLKISTRPVSQTSRTQSVEDREWNESSDGQTLYNPGSLSEICLKVDMLKAHHPPLVTATSAMDQDADSDAPNSATLHTAGSRPDCSGEEMQKQEFDRCAITGSSSEDENEHVTSLSSDDSVEHDAAVSSQSDGDGTSLMNEEQGSTPPQFPEVADSFLDVSRAYEEDVLVLDVIQDDPELFGAVVTETVSKQETLAEENGKTPQKTEKLQMWNHCNIVWDLSSDG